MSEGEGGGGAWSWTLGTGRGKWGGWMSGVLVSHSAAPPPAVAVTTVELS